MMLGPGRLGVPGVLSHETNFHLYSLFFQSNPNDANGASQEQQAAEAFLLTNSSEQIQLMNELQSKIREFDQLKDAREHQSNLISVENDDAMSDGDANEPVDTESPFPKKRKLNFF